MSDRLERARRRQIEFEKARRETGGAEVEHRPFAGDARRQLASRAAAGQRRLEEGTYALRGLKSTDRGRGGAVVNPPQPGRHAEARATNEAMDRRIVKQVAADGGAERKRRVLPAEIPEPGRQHVRSRGDVPEPRKGPRDPKTFAKEVLDGLLGLNRSGKR